MTPAQTAARERRTPDPLLIALIGIAALFLAVNGAMLWVTFRTPPQLVSASYYDDAAHYSQAMEAERASQETGWSATALESSAPGTVTLRIVDARGRPVSGMTGSIRAYRPSDADLDRALSVREQPEGSGLYVAPFAEARRGHWELRLDLKRAAGRLVATVPWTAP